jgi:uncharacterized protein YceH (UPF0502 family)
MGYELNAVETRILGALIEKDLTTPEYYPLSLNALTAACNQKSNRDPVMELSEREVEDGIESLMRQHLAWQKSGFGSRVPKYAHKLADTLSRSIDFSRAQLAILSVLMLRGAQTPGELRTRTARMFEFAATEDVEGILGQLQARDDGPFVVELPRQPGQREARFAQTLSGPVLDAGTAVPPATPVAPSANDRVAALESRVAELQAEVAALKEIVLDLRSRTGP